MKLNTANKFLISFDFLNENLNLWTVQWQVKLLLLNVVNETSYF